MSLMFILFRIPAYAGLLPPRPRLLGESPLKVRKKHAFGFEIIAQGGEGKDLLRGAWRRSKCILTRFHAGYAERYVESGNMLRRLGAK